MAVTLGGFHRQVLGAAWLLDGCARRTRAVGGFDCLPVDDNTPPLDGVRAGPAARPLAPWGFNSLTGLLIPVCRPTTAVPAPSYHLLPVMHRPGRAENSELFTE